MTAFRKSKDQLVQIQSLMKNHQQHPSMLQVEILRLELKSEKVKDRIVYQFLKNKSSNN